MKKPTILLPGVLLLCLAGCGKADPVAIEDYAWEMRSIQGGDNGAVVACAPEQAGSHEGARPLELDCRAADGSLTLTDLTNSRTWEGSYRIAQTGPETVTYMVTLGGAEGHAVTGVTAYLDGSQSPTFILTAGDYTLNFDASSAEAE